MGYLHQLRAEQLGRDYKHGCSRWSAPAGSPGYPCAAPSTLMVDALLLANADVTALAGTANVNPLHLNPSPESAGYVLPHTRRNGLPTGWQTVTLRVPAHCAGSAQIQQSPSFVVRRYATTGALTVKVLGPASVEPLRGQDTLSFVFKSNWAVSIHGLVIIDDGDDASTRGNKVTQAYPDDGVAQRLTPSLESKRPLIGGGNTSTTFNSKRATSP